MAATVEKLLLGSQASIISGTSLNGLTNNSLVLSAAFNNTIGSTGDGYAFGRWVATWKFQVAPTANTGLSVWFIKTGDAGTTYEDGASGTTPQRAPDLVFPVYADTSAHVMAIDTEIPVGLFKVLLKNDATGQTFTANNTDNTLQLTPYTRESV